jgi:glycosyltransferase involved in cell wall biosynthesis
MIECPYIFDLSGMLAFDEAERPTNKVAFLYSGRLTEFRDPLGAINAFKRVHDRYPGRAELVISGRGHLQGAVEQAISDLGLQKCCRWMLDFADWHDLRNLYRYPHVLVTLGAYNTWSLTVIEALAAGMPVIATQTTEAASAQVIEDFNGYLVQHGDAESAAQAMARYVENPALISAHGRNARAIAHATDVPIVAGRLHRMLTRSRASSPH